MSERFNQVQDSAKKFWTFLNKDIPGTPVIAMKSQIDKIRLQAAQIKKEIGDDFKTQNFLKQQLKKINIPKLALNAILLVPLGLTAKGAIASEIPANVVLPTETITRAAEVVPVQAPTTAQTPAPAPTTTPVPTNLPPVGSPAPEQPKVPGVPFDQAQRTAFATQSIVAQNNEVDPDPSPATRTEVKDADAIYKAEKAAKKTGGNYAQDGTDLYSGKPSDLTNPVFDGIGDGTRSGDVRVETTSYSAESKLPTQAAVQGTLHGQVRQELVANKSATAFRNENLGAEFTDSITHGTTGNTLSPESSVKLKNEIKAAQNQTASALKNIAINGVAKGQENVIVFDGKTASQINDELNNNPELKKKVASSDTTFLITAFSHLEETKVQFSWSNLLILWGKPTLAGSGNYKEATTIKAVGQIRLQGEDPTLIGFGDALQTALGTPVSADSKKGLTVDQSKTGVQINISGNYIVNASYVEGKVVINVDKTAGNPISVITVTNNDVIKEIRKTGKLVVGFDATSKQIVGSIQYQDGTTGTVTKSEFQRIISTKTGLIDVLTAKNPNVKSQNSLRFMNEPSSYEVTKDTDIFLKRANPNEILATLKDLSVDPSVKNHILLRYSEQLIKSDSSLQAQMNPEFKSLQSLYFDNKLPSKMRSGDVLDLSNISFSIDKGQDAIEALTVKRRKAAVELARKNQRFLFGSYVQLTNPNASLEDIQAGYQSALLELGRTGVTGFNDITVKSEFANALASVSSEINSPNYQTSKTSSITLGFGGLGGSTTTKEIYNNPLFAQENKTIDSEVSLQKAITKVSTTLGFIKLNGANINPQIATTIVQTLATVGKVPIWLFGATRTFESYQSKGDIALGDRSSETDKLNQFSIYLDALAKYQSGDYKIGQSVIGSDGKPYTVESLQAFETSLAQSVVSIKMDRDTTGKSSGVVSNMYNLATLKTAVNTPLESTTLTPQAQNAVRAILQPTVSQWTSDTKNLKLTPTRSSEFLGAGEVVKITGKQAQELGLYVALGTVGASGTSSEFAGSGLGTTGFLTFEQTKNGSSSEFFITKKDRDTLISIKNGTFRGDIKAFKLSMAQCWNGSTVVPLVGTYRFVANASTSGLDSVVIPTGYGSNSSLEQQFSGAAGLNPIKTTPNQPKDKPVEPTPRKVQVGNDSVNNTAPTVQPAPAPTVPTQPGQVNVAVPGQSQTAPAINAPGTSVVPNTPANIGPSVPNTPATPGVSVPGASVPAAQPIGTGFNGVGVNPTGPVTVPGASIPGNIPAVNPGVISTPAVIPSGVGSNISLPNLGAPATITPNPSFVIPVGTVPTPVSIPTTINLGGDLLKGVPPTAPTNLFGNTGL